MDPSLDVQPWQVEDYRTLSLETLFLRLQKQGFYLDRVSFLALADSLETPEDLADDLFIDGDTEAATQDQVYLLVFEIWRRLIPEKLCLSIFCDEFDHQINLYDRGEIKSLEPIQDAIANLEVILQDNVDEGGNHHEILESINLKCANDLEDFLYDFIADQIDNKNYSYAAELLEDFIPYVSKLKWFSLLQVRLIAVSNTAQANILIRHILQEQLQQPDLELYLEILSFLAQEGDKDLFTSLVKHILPLITIEEEFQDLLNSCAEYFHRLDLEPQEQKINKILQQHAQTPLERPFNKQNPHIAELLSILSK
jgi:hypothetical protein